MKTSAPPVLPPANNPAAAAQFEREGFFVVPSLIPPELLARVRPRIDAVYAGEYETGIPPCGSPKGRHEPPTSLVKIDNAHRSDRTIMELVGHPAIGRWAAALTGARFVQVFAAQMLIKPPGGQSGVNVGWHQDQEYWEPALQGELFTAWVAVSDVTAESGPMRFVRGSNHWGLLKAGDFFSDNLEGLKRGIQAKRGSDAWEEVPALLAPGGVSFHHRLTVHGSGPNLAALPRVSFAIHLRTEKSGLREGVRWQDAGYLNDFDDPVGSPVCYRA
jgi:ectoine hydroxylase-related dioxygenase (phytanoyl-CoA dioxygenase family)